jgi:hypothetical protein
MLILLHGDIFKFLFRVRVREDGFVGGESQKLDGEGPFGGYDGGWYVYGVWGVVL